jgi:hypothetical protein
MSKNISFEELRAMGNNRVPPEVHDYASKLQKEAETEKARATIVSYIQKSSEDNKKKQALIDAIGKMVSKDK